MRYKEMITYILCLMSLLFAQGGLYAEDFREAAKKATPAVVYIKIQGIKAERGLGLPGDPAMEEFLKRFFGLPENIGGEIAMAQASGFFVSPDGYILTNDHVVKDGGEMTVVLPDGREFPGKTIAKDPMSDLAVVKVEGDHFPYLEFGDSEKLEVGQPVMAIGNPFGLQASVTGGVVSAKGRNNLDLAKIEDFIQTDAAINMGNSGGPLVDLSGKVVGVNTAIATSANSNGFAGIGFAIPSNLAKKVYQELISGGTVKRGFLGVTLQPLTSDLSLALRLPKAEGALISAIQPGSPASKAGLFPGDVVIKINGKKVDSIGGLRNSVAMEKPGSKVNLEVIRNKKNLEIAVEVGGWDNEEKEEPKGEENALGITVEESKEGLKVVQIAKNSPLRMAGLQAGATIVSINQEEVKTSKEFYDKVKKHDKALPLLLYVMQGGLGKYISIRIP
jgi:serine protease Do